ncbi:hypothetical protein [Reyranella sp.]|uniref:hypothetical protein n=1 Tax=Reyranella sp. TaxID=1929291 RepID=UPI003D0AED43
MPDGAHMPPPDGGRLTDDHLAEIARTVKTMTDPLWARAALAWLQVVAPRRVPHVSPDPAGVAFHLALFAKEPHYWVRLCVLFDERHLSDRWGPA